MDCCKIDKIEKIIISLILVFFVVFSIFDCFCYASTITEVPFSVIDDVSWVNGAIVEREDYVLKYWKVSTALDYILISNMTSQRPCN